MKRLLSQDREALLRPDAAAGLAADEVTLSRQRYGTNVIAEQPPRSTARLLRDAAGDPMVWFLLATALLFALVGQWADTGVLIAAIVPLIGIDFYLHRRTQASIENLTSVLAAEAEVYRDGAARRCAADALVPGDLVKVTAGESFPADGVIVAGEDLQAEESSLTGEAYPVGKRSYTGVGPPEDEAWAFAGTRLLTGSANVRVLFTGADTIYGEVVRSAIAGPPGRTPLQIAVARLVRVLLVIAALICFVLAAVRVWQGFGLLDAVLSAATLAVAAIPEEFPVVLTFFLGVGVYRLARSRALARRGVAVENIGRVSAICSDKTGTITEGRLALKSLAPAKGVASDWLLTVARAASRAESADPLDLAIIEKAPPVSPEWRRAQLFPFTEGRKRETACWSGEGRSSLIAMKGAPETVIPLCDIDDAERAEWLNVAANLSAEGQKVIACAWQQVDGEIAVEPDDGLRLCGLISVADRIRSGVREAISEALGAGIQVVMITGDHRNTAAAIAREAGLSDGQSVILGDDLAAVLDRMTDRELRELTVVARATPSQKVLVVEALRRSGQIVAVTGDGVNDTPALRAADVGIAMGLRGTRSAREVSSIVLMDDNFRTIVRAIAEGRQLFQNLRLSFAFLVTVHVPLVGTAALIPFMGYPLLYLPIHIIWLELLIHPAAILGFQQPTRGLLQRTSAYNDSNFFTARQWLVIGLTSIGITAAILAIFTYIVAAGETPEHARSMALVVLVTSLSVVLPVFTRLHSKTSLALSALGFATALVFVQFSPLAAVLHLHSLPWHDWLLSILLGVVPALAATLFHAPKREQS